MATDAAVPQHLGALAKANATRLARADLRRRVFAGELDVLAILSPHHAPGVRRLEPVHELVETLPVNDLLAWPQRWGVLRARKLLERVSVRENAPLGSLTDRQRWKIVAELTGQEDPFTVPAPRPPTAREFAADIAARVAARHPPAPVVPASPPVPEPPRPRPELGVLGVACPHCRSDVGDPCSWYDPIHNRWHEPPRPCGERFTAAGIARP